MNRNGIARCALFCLSYISDAHYNNADGDLDDVDDGDDDDMMMMLMLITQCHRRYRTPYVQMSFIQLNVLCCFCRAKDAGWVSVGMLHSQKPIHRHFFGARCNGKITSLCIFVSPLTLCPFCCIFYLTVISHTLIQTLTLIYICSPNFSVDSFVFFVQCVCVFFLSVCATTSFRYCYCTWFVLTHFQPIVQNLLLASLFNRSHTRKNHNIHIGIISFVMFSFPRFISCCCCCFCFWVGYCCCCFHFSSSSHSFKQ